MVPFNHEEVPFEDEYLEEDLEKYTVEFFHKYVIAGGYWRIYKTFSSKKEAYQAVIEKLKTKKTAVGAIITSSGDEDFVLRFGSIPRNEDVRPFQHDEFRPALSSR